VTFKISFKSQKFKFFSQIRAAGHCIFSWGFCLSPRPARTHHYSLVGSYKGAIFVGLRQVLFLLKVWICHVLFQHLCLHHSIVSDPCVYRELYYRIRMPISSTLHEEAGGEPRPHKVRLRNIEDRYGGVN